MKRNVCVARQPILDRHDVVIAYEFLFRDNGAVTDNDHDGFSRTTAVVESVLGLIGMERMAGSASAFLNCTDKFLFSDLVNMLPAPVLYWKCSKTAN